jgi:hypothetical protein
MPLGVTIAITAACGVALTALGFIGGRATAPSETEQFTELVTAQGEAQAKRDAAHTEQIKAQGEVLESYGTALTTVVTEVGKPLVIDADTRAQLARTPVTCTGGDSDSLACLAALCWSYGQSAAQRPAKCDEIVEEFIQAESDKRAEWMRRSRLSCPEESANP